MTISTEKYSIAIIPSKQVVQQIKSYKDLLAENIGNYKSRNSLAHISIKEFFADERILEITRKQLRRVCDSSNPFDVVLSGFNGYTNSKAFYIEPDQFSKELLKELMKKIHKTTTVKSDHLSSDPHLSIGRGLQDLKVATKLFDFEINLRFLCNEVSIRKFNPTIKQYEILESFSLKGIQSSEPEQLSLF